MSERADLDFTGLVERGHAMRVFLNRFLRRAPALAEHQESRIDVNLKTGVRSVERISQAAVVASMQSEEIQARIETRTEQILNQAIEGAAQRAAEWRLRDMARRMEVSGPPIRDILAAVSQVTEMSAQDLVGPRRGSNYIPPRFLTYWLLKHCRPDLSLPAIGKAMNRDHTSVLHGLRKLDPTVLPYEAWLKHPAIVALMKSGAAT